MSKIIVLGGAGFVCRNLVRVLKSGNYDMNEFPKNKIYKYRKIYRISNKMATKIKIPSRVVEVLETPVEKTVVELIAIGLYRDGKITLRQAADLVSVDAEEMREVLEKHDTYT